MKVAVKDANVFIDLESMGILDLWTQLGYETLTSSFIVDELEKGGHRKALAHVRAGKVKEVIIPGEEMAALFELFQVVESNGASLEDASVLFIAIREKALLLTGDKPLRHEAAIRSVEYHGTFWILEQLVENGVLPPRMAAEKLSMLISLTGRRKRHLPRKLAESYIERWRSC